MASSALCHALLQADHHNEIERLNNRYRLIWAANALSFLADASTTNASKIEPHGKLLRWILEYDKQFGRCPDAKAVLDYVTELKTSGAASVNQETCREQLQDAKENADNLGDRLATDVPTLIESVIQIAYTLWHAHIGVKYSEKALGAGEKIRENGVERKTVPKDAMNYLREQWAKNDLRDFAPRPSGVLQENTEFLHAEIDRMEQGVTEDERIRLGLPHIDEQIAFSKRLRPFVGIMGFANDGKTTLLMSILYSMALNRKSVILFTKEHDTVDAWLDFAFLHSHQYRNEFVLPSKMEFENRNVSPEDWRNLRRVVDDIKAGTGIPGRIEVQILTTWDDLVGHLNTNNGKARYDVCAIDYLTRVDMPWSKPQFHNQDMATQISMAQSLTRNFDGGRGIMLISPMQINRTGYKEAKKSKEGKKHDLTSISQFSQFYQDMDFIVSLYSDDKMKLASQVLMETQKVRGAAFPPSKLLHIDACSRRVSSSANDAVLDKNAADFMAGRVSPISQIVREQVLGIPDDMLDEVTNSKS